MRDLEMYCVKCVYLILVTHRLYLPSIVRWFSQTAGDKMPSVCGILFVIKVLLLPTDEKHYQKVVMPWFTCNNF